MVVIEITESQLVGDQERIWDDLADRCGASLARVGMDLNAKSLEGDVRRRAFRAYGG